ncbi:MAG: response regulator [Chloroflexota bacterium]
MPRRILIVEDDPELAAAEQNILQDEGYEVLHALDGVLALEVLSHEAVDLVLLDVNMPRMNGHELCRRLRQNPDTAHLNILMVTALGSIEETIAGLEAGADDYLPKPFEVPELLARVRAQLRLRALQERLVGMEKRATITQMIITLSHEINNPLTSILWHAQLAQEKVSQSSASVESCRRALDVILNEARRIERVIGQLQDLQQPVVTEYLPGIQMIDLRRSGPTDANEK